MGKFEDHPTVAALRARPAALMISAGREPAFSSAMLRELCLNAGADDVGFVPIDEPTLAPDRERIKAAFPGVRTLVAIVCRMQMENVRSPARSIANQAFHTTGHEVDEVCRRITLALQDKGVRACNPSMAFPMEVGDIPEETPWVVSHKIVAEAAGLGRMGLHRSVIHPRFGSFILLGTVLIDREVDAYARALDYNPCVDCRLCVAACPVGALAPDGHFNAAACATHNYREFLGGFVDWIDTLADADSARGYQRRVTDAETLSMWQSLAYGPNYKAAYCLSVCPAGEDVLGPFIEKRAEHVARVMRPLQEKVEPLYVVRGSDAEAHARKRFPHKPLRHVRSGLRPTSPQSFLRSLHWMFQREQSEGLSATYHFVFTGPRACDATITIRDKRIDVRSGLHDAADVRIVADGMSWVRFVRGEANLAWLLATRRIRLSPVARGAALLRAFGRCFPG